MARHATAGDVIVLTEGEATALGKRVIGFAGGEPVTVGVFSEASATNSFARGDAHLMAEETKTEVEIKVKDGSVSTTRLDDDGLTSAIRAVRGGGYVRDGGRLRLLGEQTYATPPQRFFESLSAAVEGEGQGKTAGSALDATEAAGLVGFGKLNLSASSMLYLDSAGLVAYDRSSYGELSLTARTKDGTGSGWAWSGHEDWGRVDPAAAIARAVDLARRSANPVAVEPGRYTVILEPAAVADLCAFSIFDLLASTADAGGAIFSGPVKGTNKVGRKMLDERLSFVFDPWDSDMPQSTVSAFALEPAGKFTMFEHGVLKDLMYTADYAKSKNREPALGPTGVRISAAGPRQTLDEMIASTKRGIWVNRLSGVRFISRRTYLKTGTTRDGTFLIENGKITKAIKNLRFMDSPFFALNKVEAVGEPMRALRGAVVPRIKVRDFDFTSLTDAI